MAACDLAKANPMLLRQFYNFLTVAERYGMLEVTDLQKTLLPYK